MTVKIENYGHIPFKGFHFVIIGWIVLMFTYVDLIASTMEKIPSWLKLIIYLLPLILVIYYDVRYSSFSIRNMANKMFGVSLKNTNWEDVNRKINYVLKVLGAYGIIQVLAQDIGVKTGKNQAELMRKEIVQWLLFTGTAYCVLNNRSEAMIGATVYFILKLNFSEKETQEVCFTDV
tara:strand:+ start:4326 stop:4856 length:531 start_codon:yes stop_codon:yes gene_type:complete